MPYFYHYQNFIIIFCFFLLPFKGYNQSYNLNKNFIENVRTDKNFAEKVLELNIDSTAKENDVAITLLGTKQALDELKKLKNLRSLHFNMLCTGNSSVDTIITFDPEDFDETVELIYSRKTWSAYTILSILNDFPELETLTLNFRGNNLYATDFDWVRITGNVEKEMIEAYSDCFWKMYDNKFNVEDCLLVIDSLKWMNWVSIFEEKQDTSITADLWEPDTSLTDEEYCKQQPEFCDEFGKPFFNRNSSTPIDTNFIVCREWPSDTTSYSSKNWKEIMIIDCETCDNKILENPNWKAYGKAVYNLSKWADCFKNGDSDEILYSSLSNEFQLIVNQATNPQKSKLENRFNNEKLIQKLFLKATWATLKPWGIKSREELLFEQLPKLKNLKNLHLANYSTLDLEKLLDTLVKYQPNLERLLLSNCGIAAVPTQINQLNKLKHLGLKYNKLTEIPKLELTGLQYLCLEGNPITNLLQEEECLSYQQWRTRYANYLSIDSIFLYGEDAKEFIHRIPLSEKHLVYGYRSEKDLYILNVEDVSFSGIVSMPHFTIKSSSVYYEYRYHHLRLNSIKQLIFYDLNQKPIKSAIENFSGVLSIDNPEDKMGELQSDKPYPYIVATSKAKIYYEKAKLPYSKSDFYYELEPFVVDNLSKLEVSNLSFNGTLHSGGILNLVNEPLRVVPDYSLGFEVDFYQETPFYIKNDSIGEMQFVGHLQLDNQGLYGSGQLIHPKWTIESDSILFTTNKVYILISENFKSTKAFPKKFKKGEWYVWEVYDKKSKWGLR